MLTVDHSAKHSFKHTQQSYMLDIIILYRQGNFKKKKKGKSCCNGIQVVIGRMEI